MASRAIDFTKAPRRGRFEAWVLDKAAPGMNKQYGRQKEAVIGAMSGTVVEIGPGAGANMAYYADGVKVIGIEPNPAMHPRLQAAADKWGTDLEIRTLRGEQIDVDDASADGVVATLVLCGVTDPAQVVSEVKRVLKPGGTYFFLEHVAAREGSKMRKLQSVVNRPHRWMFNGCEVHRRTGELLADAGFTSIEFDEIHNGARAMYTPDFIIGTAVR